MQLSVEEMRGRNQQRLERWWNAWTVAGGVQQVAIMNPQQAKPDALCAFLLDLLEASVDVILLERDFRSAGYEAIMAEVDAVDGMHSPPACGCRAPAAATGFPNVPRTGTLTFLSVASTVLPPEEFTRVEQAYHIAAEQSAGELQLHPTPETFERLLYKHGAECCSSDHLLVMLHATQAAAWRTSTSVRFDPHAVIAKAGPHLQGRGDRSLWLRITSQVNANRAVAQGLTVLGVPANEIADYRIQQGRQALRNHGELPKLLHRPLQVALQARASDGAGDEDRLLVDPTTSDVTNRTIARWGRSSITDHFAPTASHHLRRAPRSARLRLSDLGVEWANE